MYLLLQVFFLVPFVAIFIGAIIICVAIFYKGKGSGLKQTGTAVTGIIENIIKASGGFNYRSNNSGINFNSSNRTSDEIIVAFTTADNRMIKGNPKTGSALSYQNLYKKGQSVKVYYDPAAPNNFILDAGKMQIAWRILAGFIGIIFLGFGIAILRFF